MLAKIVHFQSQTFSLSLSFSVTLFPFALTHNILSNYHLVKKKDSLQIIRCKSFAMHFAPESISIFFSSPAKFCFIFILFKTISLKHNHFTKHCYSLSLSFFLSSHCTTHTIAAITTATSYGRCSAKQFTCK